MDNPIAQALWVGTGGGLARYHEGNWQIFTKENSGIMITVIPVVEANKIEAKLLCQPGGGVVF